MGYTDGVLDVPITDGVLDVPITVSKGNGNLRVICIPRMSEFEYNFFLRMLKIYKDTILRRKTVIRLRTPGSHARK